MGLQSDHEASVGSRSYDHLVTEQRRDPIEPELTQRIASVCSCSLTIDAALANRAAFSDK